MITIPAYEGIGYFGGKEASGTPQKIINEIRPHDAFISGFLGNCAVMRWKQPALVNFGLDADSEVIENWKKAETGPNFDFTHCNTLEFLPDLLKMLNNVARKICIYLDPPYRMASRKSPKSRYKYEMLDSQHEQLLAMVLSLSKIEGVDIIISHYPDEVYDTVLTDWRKVQFQSSTRQGMATENLYMNYEHTTGKLHQYDFFGKDKDERYNIRNREVRTMLKRFQQITDPRRQQALLHFLEENLKPQPQPQQLKLEL